MQGNRLWVTDIDVVWVFDLTTRRGKKLPLPGVQFANDVAGGGGVLYVTDNRARCSGWSRPISWRRAPRPRSRATCRARRMNPNEGYPVRGDGSIVVVGFMRRRTSRGASTP